MVKLLATEQNTDMLPNDFEVSDNYCRLSTKSKKIWQNIVDIKKINATLEWLKKTKQFPL